MCVIGDADVLAKYPDLQKNFCAVQDDEGEYILFARIALERYFKTKTA
jgi:hypothetical protein